ncbi:MAG: family peptidase [Cyanobacteriota bacterium erpe_2018_sw_39hr_WHONDRS-SW48-000098_B_bin.30]|jgi:hypothetical protein|nr:family peptidase [Cyanobacteriota bacterium erpe_2018_sw_39hr_WHONDRS-SW48-000098_B_bin.30]
MLDFFMLEPVFGFAVIGLLVLALVVWSKKSGASRASKTSDENDTGVPSSSSTASGDEEHLTHDHRPAAGDAHDHSASAAVSHEHGPPPGVIPELTPLDDDFDPVHTGKVAYRGCKFDPAEVRRTLHLVTPKIDMSNIPPPNPAVVAALNGVSLQRITDRLMQFTGEVPMIVGGVSQTISSRSTFHSDLGIALSFIVEQYTAIGIKVRRVPYKVRGKTFENIEAEIPGTTNPEKVVLFGAHADATAGSPWALEAKTRGADDDGSGTIGCLELALAIKALKLPYTVRILHFTGEEQGLWGSYAYSDMIKKAGQELVDVVQIDMIAYCAKPGNRVDIHDSVDRNGSHATVVKFFRAIKRYNIQLTPVDTHNHAVDNRSDVAGFLDHGYRGVLISEEFSDDGFNPNYHTLGDRVKNCNLPYMVEVVKASIALAADLAGAP